MREKIIMQLAPYLLFNGNCREAMTFYAQCFSGLLEFVTYGECPSDEIICPKSASVNEDNIIYSALRNNENLFPFITAADLPYWSTDTINNGQITICCTSNIQIEHLFQQLSQEGKIVQPLTNVFWSARIGRVVDKYGINWFLNYQID
ncbi:TPA: VOC family protein [Legionella pneumophila]